MSLSTEVAFYHKIGTVAEDKTVFKYFLASMLPHFYFVVYVVPYENTVDIFYIPKIDNMDSFSVVPLFDDSLYGSVHNVGYGQTTTITLSNEKIHGLPEVVEVGISIPFKPVIVNNMPVTEVDMDEARQIASESASILSDARLYTLANQLMITVESKIGVLVDASTGVDIEGATYSIIQQLLLDKSVLYTSLPAGMTTEKKDILHRMLNTMINLSPYSTNISVIFSDIISFARLMNDSEISFETIPYHVLYRLTYKTLSEDSNDAKNDIVSAALAVEKSIIIGINMSTMEESAKVYGLINAIQSFVYLTEIKFLNVETGDIKAVSFDYLDSDILVKKKSVCIESRSAQAQSKKVTLQYGYGSGCDLFIGMIFVDEFGSFGIVKEEKLLDGDKTTSRKWIWGDESSEMFGSEINSSNNIEVTFKGV